MELIEAFRILYASYRDAGLVAENPLKVRLTAAHLLPTTEVLVAKCGGEVISTLSLIGDGEDGLPLEAMYGREVAQLRRNGHRLGEIGCLADRRESPIRFIKTLESLTRLSVQVAEQRKMNALVLAAHPRHAKYYMRTLGFKQVGGLTQCPYARGNPAVALMLDFESIRNTQLHDRLFGNAIESQQLAATSWHPTSVNFVRTLFELQNAPPEPTGEPAAECLQHSRSA